MNNFQSLLVALTFIGVVFAPVTCSMNTNSTIENMVKAGTNPADAKCAVSAMYQTVICTIRATTQSKKAAE